MVAHEEPVVVCDVGIRGRAAVYFIVEITKHIVPQEVASRNDAELNIGVMQGGKNTLSRWPSGLD